MSLVEWIAVDWGTSNVRVWVFGADDTLIEERSSDRGMGALKPDEFEPTLLGLICDRLGTGRVPVICCGMVGARQGWAEAAYAQAPCPPPDANTALRVQANEPRLDVRILPGVMQKSPADVMRGEEIQIAGFLAQNPKFFGTICLPGTHTKWVQISAGEIVSFRTFMTGELFSLLGTKSVLRHSVSGDGWSDEAFHEAVSDAMGAPQQVASRLFSLRAGGLVNELDHAEARARLSGYLIGMELAGARGYWLGQDLALIGDPALTKLYGDTLTRQGTPSRAISGNEMTLAGLKAAHAALEKDAL
ncbi:2-dehydro-3-deoxygalactonokinase [Sulfitobacter sp.]|uniref:2-dehydro-3-deoxygalactonokinase n=1 Tax=Sulfitobacter sp. TaxID=1903071 RepID=UPI0030013C78